VAHPRRSPSPSTRPARLLLAAGAVLALGACADEGPAGPDPTDEQAPTDTDGDPGDGPDGPADDGDTAGDVDPDAPVDDDQATEEAARPEGAAPLPGDATADDQEQAQSSDARLTLTDVRVGAHDGFDRVTLEVSGQGAVGWFTHLEDEARTHGRGDQVELAGDHALTVAIRGAELPPERADDVEAFTDEHGRVPAPDGATVLTEVAIGTVFEGQKQVFVGLTEATAYRVARFEAPERIVIDLVHP
jgi:hypothetical protein